MAKVERKETYVIDGGVYDHETKTITVDMKDGYVEIQLDELLPKLDGYQIKLTASTDVVEG